MAKSRNNRKPGAGKLLRTQVITHHREYKTTRVLGEDVVTSKLVPNTIRIPVKAAYTKTGAMIRHGFDYHKPISKTIIHSRRVAA
jgi:hypothetical protein